MPNTEMGAADVVVVLELRAKAGVDCWMNGGWGVDALVGRQTRLHEDLDLVIGMSDVAPAIAVLQEAGFQIDEDLRPISFTMCTTEGRKVDFHPVTWNAEGDGVQAQPANSSWTYPAQGFRGVGLVAGRHVKCLTAKVQILCHDGYDLDSGDLHDLELMRRMVDQERNA